MPSGWQTLIGTVDETKFVDWLPSTASVWREKIFDRFQFDEYFDRYSYLEDLDFSYGVRKYYKLAVAHDARFYHYPSSSGRITEYQFGEIEVRNRIYFVRKHDLSRWRCYLAVMIRMLITIKQTALREKGSSLNRLHGNIAGVIQSLR